MFYQRFYIEQHLQRFIRPKRPDLEKPLRDAFDELLESGKPLSETSLIAVVDAASDRYASVYELGATFLGESAILDNRALQMIQEMALSKHAHVHHNALLCLTEKTQEQVCLGMIRDGLKDKSSRVRTKAADWAHRLRLRGVVQDIAKVLKTETHNEAAQTMRAAIEVLQAEEN
ncbi:hypothetical protein [Undibacterium sp. TS12]|uniref:hypothetical protein n=1 Tax=Undibacterium sp. TS12 TaxID=2908202 RepID=UPI001F4CA24C|nr:hypothetical protein [Undibacterium sp. TS12]MCH8622558.1 hypothetical protein [Undibacterium sp. TS12]